MKKNLENYLSQLREKGYRITKSRIALLEVLSDEHLTFKQIQMRLAEKGFTNVASIYNNIDFFLQEKVIVVLFINQVRYYELAIDNKMHTADNHIHLVDQANNQIVEINNKRIYDSISRYIENDTEYEVSYIRLTVGVSKKETE
ncbi:MAG: transcriptional repressor [Acholeplasmataceae bacterium]|mgnify:CR=1 FL=1|nr:transcriptional repressor [Acholeplasmataceae bacterium]